MPYHAPRTAADALALVRDHSPRIVAGCTDFYPSLERGQGPDTILDVTGIQEWNGITKTADGWRMGATTTWTDILRADVPPAFDGLKAAAKEVGSVQIQNRATVAGNICNASPAADGVPPLLTLGAQVEVSSALGLRTLPLAEFITGVRETALEAGEIVTALHLPDPPDHAKSAFVKLGSRTHLVISIAMVAVLVTVQDDVLTDVRIAVGSCAPVAQRLPAMEHLFTGRPVTDVAQADLADPALLASLSPISDIRGTAEYRLDVVPELCRRAIEEACAS